MLRTFARRHSVPNDRLTFLGSRGVPLFVVNTRPSVLARATCVSPNWSRRWRRKIATSSPGNGTEAADDSVFTSRKARFAPTLQNESPSVHPSLHRPNRLATLLLFQATEFTAAEVPLLYGHVVLASHDELGPP
jgi:hypothetical protein